MNEPRIILVLYLKRFITTFFLVGHQRKYIKVTTFFLVLLYENMLFLISEPIF